MTSTPPPRFEGTALAPRDASIEERIQIRSRDFSAPALVALLRALRPNGTLRLASRPSLATHATIVHSVEFGTDGSVLVTLNLGLGSATSPLPSYFLKLLADSRIGDPLRDLLAFADEPLLRDRIAALDPESAPRLFPDVRRMRQRALALSRPASPLTAHWIFAAVFPELGVTVRRSSVRRGMQAEGLRLGSGSLGRAAFGDEAEVMVAGLEVILCTEDSKTADGRPWDDEALDRLRARAFPALRRASAHLRVLLVDRESKSRLVLEEPSQFGFDSLVEAKPPRVSLLFEGRVPELQKVAPRGSGV